MQTAGMLFLVLERTTIDSIKIPLQRVKHAAADTFFMWLQRHIMHWFRVPDGIMHQVHFYPFIGLVSGCGYNIQVITLPPNATALTLLEVFDGL